MSDNPDTLDKFCRRNRSSIAEDQQGAPVFLARNAWTLKRETQDWPDIRFVNVKERN